MTHNQYVRLTELRNVMWTDVRFRSSHLRYVNKRSHLDRFSLIINQCIHQKYFYDFNRL